MFCNIFFREYFAPHKKKMTIIEGAVEKTSDLAL